MSDIFHKYQQEQEAMLNRYATEYFTIKRYNTIMDKLRELNAIGRDNTYWYGDADVYAHIETIEDIDCLVINNVVSCYDRPVCVIQVKDRGETLPEEFHRYQINAICTENVSKKPKIDYSWGDRRDYEVVGLDVIREKGFKYLYGDIRDVEWAFNLCFFSRQMFENLTRDNTLFILQEMDYLFNNLENLQR